jgi:hypothetical protein
MSERALCSLQKTLKGILLGISDNKILDNKPGHRNAILFWVGYAWVVYKYCGVLLWPKLGL